MIDNFRHMLLDFIMLSELSIFKHIHSLRPITLEVVSTAFPVVTVSKCGNIWWSQRFWKASPPEGRHEIVLKVMSTFVCVYPHSIICISKMGLGPEH